jgi:hypothetical protein
MESSSATVDIRSASRATSDCLESGTGGSKFFEKRFLVLVVVCICKCERCHDLEPKQRLPDFEWLCSETVLGIRHVAMSFGYFKSLNEQSVKNRALL